MTVMKPEDGEEANDLLWRSTHSPKQAIVSSQTKYLCRKYASRIIDRPSNVADKF